MNEAVFEEQLEMIVNQLKERFNLAIATAVDDKKSFDEAELIFQEAIGVLDCYHCYDVIAEQTMNFSKVAFFRQKYVKALYYASLAVEKSKLRESVEKNSENLHSMAYKCFEIILMREDVEISFEDIEQFLVPEDYCVALLNMSEGIKHIHAETDKAFLAGVLKKLSLEVMRQGLRQEKEENKTEALKLFEMVLPFLNPKRAEIIAKEIKKLKES